MDRKYPSLRDLEDSLNALTEDDVKHAKSDRRSSLAPNEKLMGIPLGGNLRNLLDAARFYVLALHLSRQGMEIERGAVSVPQNMDKERWLRLLGTKIVVCECMCSMEAEKLAILYEVEVPEDARTWVAFHKGAFHATIIYNTLKAEDDGEVVFTPEGPGGQTYH